MDVRRFDDPDDYADLVLPYLLLEAARHNLALGVLDVIRRSPAIYPVAHLWAVVEEGVVVGAALQTPPYNLIVAAMTGDEATPTLVEAITAAGVRPPGVVGARPEADRFAEVWCARHGGRATVITEQGVYALTAVRDEGDAPGEPRLATEFDLDLLDTWTSDFLNEAVPQHLDDAGMRRRRLEQVVAEGGYWLWLDARAPVSMTGAHAAPPAGARIGPVYTPPEHRGRGYATALVAAASAARLAAGASACYLHTDLANPTSNAIYRRIGYDWVCEAVDVRFEP